MESHAERPRFTLSLRRFRQLAIVVVAGVCLLTVAGAIVRLTGSGLGCDDWPNCNNERFIDVSSGHAAIEQVNRLLSGFIGIPTLLLAVGAFRVWPRRRGLRGPALAVLLTILGNGVVGGTGRPGGPAPDTRPVPLHPGDAVDRLRSRRRAPLWYRCPSVGDADIGITPLVTGLFVTLGLFVAAALVTGTVVTGAGPHAGDETARRYGFDISTVAEVHSVTVWIAVAVFLALAVALRRTPGLSDRFGAKISTWMFLAVLQGGIGYVQYFNNVPAVLVAAHVAGATALWVATVWLILAGLEPVTSADGQVHAPETERTVGESLPVGYIP